MKMLDVLVNRRRFLLVVGHDMPHLLIFHAPFPVTLRVSRAVKSERGDARKCDETNQRHNQEHENVRHELLIASFALIELRA